MEIRSVSEDEYESFLREKEYTVVLFDAPWDVGPGALIRPPFEKAARAFGGRVNFGEVNTDEFTRVPKSISVANVPTVAYFRGGQLVAAMVGAQQDVAARTQAMMDGKRIGRKDGLG